MFRAWLVRKQDDHEEGEEITPDELMMAAKNKFDAMKEKGTWNAPTAEEKIVALEAKFDSTVKSLNKKVSFEMGKKGGKGKSADKGRKSDLKSDDHPKKWPPPKSGDKKEANFKGHTWYWCSKETGGKCEKWRAHKPSECKGIAAGTKREAESSKSGGKGDKKNRLAKKLKVAKAYVAKIEQKAANLESSSESENE